MHSNFRRLSFTGDDNTIQEHEAVLYDDNDKIHREMKLKGYLKTSKFRRIQKGI